MEAYKHEHHRLPHEGIYEEFDIKQLHTITIDHL